MSIPSITLRLDFGESVNSGVTAAISQQGEPPTPMGLMPSSTHVAHAALSAPSTRSADTAVRDSAPAPLAGMDIQTDAPQPSAEVVRMSAALNAPPVPSLDVASALAVGMIDDLPRPEGEPGAVKKPTSKG